MKLTSLAMAAVLSVGYSSSWAAGGPLDLSSGSTGFNSTPAAGPFTDLWTFTLTTPSFLSASITAVVSGTQDVDLSLIQIIGTATTVNFTQLLPDPVETWALASATLPAGNYTLSITGTNSAAMGSYAGNVAVTAVPEPETYALLAAGLLLVGLKLRTDRR